MAGTGRALPSCRGGREEGAGLCPPSPAQINLPGTLKLASRWTAAKHLLGRDLHQACPSLVPPRPPSTPHPTPAGMSRGGEGRQGSLEPQQQPGDWAGGSVTPREAGEVT